MLFGIKYKTKIHLNPIILFLKLNRNPIKKE
jgi:hypothetical protein